MLVVQRSLTLGNVLVLEHVNLEWICVLLGVGVGSLGEVKNTVESREKSRE